MYTHVSEQFSVFSTCAISCSVREALYVLDGLLENDTDLDPREHSTDTHGYAEQLFGLCYLLDFSFMPRVKDLGAVQLYRPDRAVSYGDLDAIFRGGVVDLALVREQWDQLVHAAASLKRRTSPAHVVLERLASSSDRLARALTALGRLVKSTYILRYVNDPAIRRRVQLQLKPRGVAPHPRPAPLLRQPGRLQEEIMNKVSALSLLSNAALVWNTVRIGEVVADLEKVGEAVTRVELTRISPLMFRHIIPNGTYSFDRVSAKESPLT